MLSRFLVGTLFLSACSGDGADGGPSELERPLAPTVAFADPLEGATFVEGDAIPVEIVVTDADTDDLTQLTLTWGGSGATQAPPRVDGDGRASFAIEELPVGNASLTVTVLDADGLSAAAGVAFVVESDSAGIVDNDEDGFPVGEDCNDDDDTIYPGAVEVCDGVDQDCDDEIDEGVLTTFYADADSDSYGDAEVSMEGCEAPAGFVANDEDCDDSTDAVSPGVAEVCNGIDDDCDTLVDIGVPGTPTWYADTDNDQFGDPNTAVQACEAPAGFVDAAGDCDDGSSAVNPGATEVCNAVDDDCDGTVDGPSAQGTLDYYRDADGDQYGDPALVQRACSAPIGYVATAGDCNDGAAFVNPGATEVCNTFDDDCDGVVDGASATNASDFYADVDSDQYGNPAVVVRDCVVPQGFVSNAGDCDDTRADVNPGVPEVCNGRDDDCDTLTDDQTAIDATTWYADVDADTYGNPSTSVVACDQPTNFVANASDCDDTSGSVNPAADEVCNGIDDNCDAMVDDPSSVDAPLWFADGDSDGFGDANQSTAACQQPAGFVSDPTDCDDQAGAVYPGATELCNGIDDNCDTLVDDPSADDALSWYEDFDLDGYGNLLVAVVDCAQPAGFVADATDCDDMAIAVNPGAIEVCNGIDDDCDTSIDGPGAADAPTWYADTDVDTFGDPNSTTTACTQPSGYVADNTDCDDMVAAVNPSAVEVCNGVDDNCDSLTDDPSSADAPTWFADADTDTYGDPNVSIVDCVQPANHVADSTDCDDSLASVNPGAAEVCGNGIDEDCSGVPDDGPTCGPLCPVYVDPTVLPGGDGSQANPFPNIAYALAFRSTGCDDILLVPGTYDGNVNYGGQDVNISSTGGPAVTTLTSSIGGTIVTFDSGETPAAVLEGVTITGGSGASGAGIRIVSSSPTIRDVVVTNNQSSTSGGGIYGSNFGGSIEDSTISFNLASAGGGIRLDNSTADISYNVFDGNASAYGGAMSVFMGSPSIHHNEFLNNSRTSNFGAGFPGKTAGVYLETSGAAVYNNLFDANQGIAIGVWTPNASAATVIANNTIVNTSDDGISLYVSSGITVINNIVAFSTGFAYRTQSTSALTVQDNNFFGASSPTGSSTNINIDPMFVGVGDYELQFPSQSVDSGQNAAALGVTDDLLDRARPMGLGYDMGCYESW